MIIVTARIPKRRLLAGGISLACCLLVLVTALVLNLNRGVVPTSASVTKMDNNQARVSYLQQLGWSPSQQPSTTQELMVPQEFDESYDSYLALQQQQGFDLSASCGKRIQRYIYQVSNHPSGKGDVQAVLLVRGDTLIGGHIQAADGSFVEPLRPTTSTPAPSSAPSAAPSAAPSTALRPEATA